MVDSDGSWEQEWGNGYKKRRYLTDIIMRMEGLKPKYSENDKVIYGLVCGLFTAIACMKAPRKINYDEKYWEDR